jgi:hypothetical protein
LQVRRLVPPPSHEPAAGHEWLGIRARICMHPDAKASGKLPWSSWLVTDRNGDRYAGHEQPGTDFPPQRFPTTPIQPGTCSAGWVLADVPRGNVKQLKRVAFVTRTANPFVWRL